MPNYTKICSFLHAHYTETLKGVEKFVKYLFNGENTHLLNGHMLYVPTTYVTEIKETYFEISVNKYHIHRLSSFKNISNCQSVLKYLSLNGKLFIY